MSRSVLAVSARLHLGLRRRLWLWGRLGGIASLVLLLATAPLALAQPTAVHKTTLQEQAFPAAPLHTVMVKTVVDPGGEVALHTHPGLEMAYVAAGEARVSRQGHAPVNVSAGGSFAIAPGVVHSVKNIGTGPLNLVSTYVVDRSKPIAIPAH